MRVITLYKHMGPYPDMETKYTPWAGNEEDMRILMHISPGGINVLRKEEVDDLQAVAALHGIKLETSEEYDPDEE